MDSHVCRPYRMTSHSNMIVKTTCWITEHITAPFAWRSANKIDGGDYQGSQTRHSHYNNMCNCGSVYSFCVVVSIRIRYFACGLWFKEQIATDQCRLHSLCMSWVVRLDWTSKCPIAARMPTASAWDSAKNQWCNFCTYHGVKREFAAHIIFKLQFSFVA